MIQAQEFNVIGMGVILKEKEIDKLLDKVNIKIWNFIAIATIKTLKSLKWIEFNNEIDLYIY